MGEAKSSDTLSVWRVALIAVVLTATICTGAAAEPRSARVPVAGGSRQVTTIPQLQADLLAAINDFRASRGLGRLRLNNALALTSVSHSISMAKHGFFSHEGYDGSAFWQRIKARYKPASNSAWEVGENLLWGTSELDAQQALDLWLQSPPHRRTLLTAAWRDVGVGAVSAKSAPGVYQGLDVTIVTADFGVR